MDNHIYIAIDLKSFFASAECVKRGLDPLNTNLVVADPARTEKTICLAVTPTLKAYGIAGRARLFEVIQRVNEINADRRAKAPGHTFSGISFYADELAANPGLELGYITAPPRMALYMSNSTRIYDIYLRYVAPEDMHVYSVDEVFMDVTHYLNTYKLTPRELAVKMIKEVLTETGITATAGIGTNMYLCKVAMDIVAKHVKADKDGVRIAELDEMSYRKYLWSHRPLTDFWRVGHGTAKKLENNNLMTMGDVARCSIGGSNDFYNEEFLYKLFGINAELLIDHAWGWEPCTIEDIKSYKPSENSLSTGQVLQCPYNCEKTKLIVREMTDLLVLDLVSKHLVTDQIVINIEYDIENLTNSEISSRYHGEIVTDHYGRKMPKHAHGTKKLDRYTSSTKLIIEAAMELYDKIINPDLLTRKINVAANRTIPENKVLDETQYEQLDFFTDLEKKNTEDSRLKAELDRERKMQEAILELKEKFGKNAVLKGMNLEEGAMTIKRNGQIGGHKA